MSEDRKSIEVLMAEGAVQIAQILQNGDASDGDKIKAFISLTEYFKVKQKAGGNDSLPSGAVSFDRLRDRMMSANGSESDESE